MAPGGRAPVTTTGKGPERSHPHQGLAGIAVVAHVTEDDQHPEVRQAAEVHAREHGCMLILFAADVASSWSEPMPNQWASEGEGDRFGDRLSPEDLEFLGRSAIAGQVREVVARGGRASAWLPKDKGIAALAAYASVQRAHVVFVPESLDSIHELRPLLATSATPPTRPGRRSRSASSAHRTLPRAPLRRATLAPQEPESPSWAEFVGVFAWPPESTVAGLVLPQQNAGAR